MSFEYDGLSHIPSASITNLVEGDSVTTTVITAQTDPGNYNAQVSAISGTASSNYKLPASALSTP